MGRLSFEIKQVPDLSLNKYQSLADTGVGGVLKRHESFLRQWHGICSVSSTSLHLLYAFCPDEDIGKRLKLFLILQGEDAALEMIEPLLFSSPLSDFYTLTSARLPEINFGAGATLTKKERVAEIINPLTNQPVSIHYVPKWEVNEDARLYDLLRMLGTIGLAYSPKKACAFRIDLYPQSTVQETRDCFAPVLKSLRGENDIKLVKDADSLKGDDYVRDICKEYDEWLECIETSPHFRVNIYGFAETVFKAKVILNAAGAEALSEGDFSIAPIKEDPSGGYTLLSRMGNKADDYCFFPKQAKLTSWSTTYSLAEVLPFFRMPVLFDGENIELPKETAPVQVADGLYFGWDMQNYPVKYALKDLAKHAFFTGMPGSGKTNTMLHLVSELKKNEIPFLALEPAKKEYRALLGQEGMQDVYLFSPHLQSHFPLRMNPLEFPKGVRVSEHINALLEVFEGSFVLEGPTFKFLSSAIQRAYTDLGWDIEDTNTENCDYGFPNLQDVYDNLKAEIDASSYNSEIKGNVRAFLQVRLGSLMERDAGEIFNARISTIAPGKWLNVSAIVELEVLAEQSKNFFVLMVCHYILETLRADPDGGVDQDGNKKPVRHVIFIEEAHNIIAPSAEQSSSDSIDPKISATAYIVKMLAEVRALREAIIIADQLPTALAGEVTKNTGLKLVHRLTAQDDREQIGTAISASPLQLEQMASFSMGRALIHHEKTIKPFEVQIAEWKAPSKEFKYADDCQLYRNTINRHSMQKTIKTALWDWEERNVFPLDSRREAFGKKYKLMDHAERTVKKTQLLTEAFKLKKKAERLQALWIVDSSHQEQLCEDFAVTLDCIDGIIDRLNQI